ncbi:hypothetical protein F4801DRAFT_584539 [Xylaria longipes]|nr:hypothetical protein F4801DRAFT_584539 [Xylaria longipes]
MISLHDTNIHFAQSQSLRPSPSPVIDRHIKYLKSIKALLNLINSEEALQTLAASAAAKDVQGAGMKLKTHLWLMQKRSKASKIEQIVWAFFLVSKDDNKI